MQWRWIHFHGSYVAVLTLRIRLFAKIMDLTHKKWKLRTCFDHRRQSVNTVSKSDNICGNVLIILYFCTIGIKKFLRILKKDAKYYSLQALPVACMAHLWDECYKHNDQTVHKGICKLSLAPETHAKEDNGTDGCNDCDEGHKSADILYQGRLLLLCGMG